MKRREVKDRGVYGVKRREIREGGRPFFIYPLGNH